MLAATKSSIAPEKFVLETDQAPEFWQFVNGLRGDDLLVELIVNELDAKARRTAIVFETDRLICSGDGEPVDAEGWDRLRRIKGAGHDVKAKVGMFGVKNHGLKACFTVGNDILIRSAGKQILQTLFAKGARKPPFPGVRVPPRDDPGAPPTGTRIEVTYRRKAFTVPDGEALSFAAVDDDQIAATFRDAVAQLPRRLLGIIRPGVLDRYTLELRHHRLGARVFTFSAGRTKRVGNVVTFFRECREGEEVIVREQACLVATGLRSASKPTFFQAETYMVAGKPLFERLGLVIEVAWEVDAVARWTGGAGRLRYPIAYPNGAGSGAAGAGFHVSGPFVSGTERHALAEQAAGWNAEVLEAGDRLITRVLVDQLLPRFGARSLELVAALPAERLTRLVDRLLRERALPVVDRDGKPVTRARPGLIVVPAYTDRQSDWAEPLARVAPPGMVILDPKAPSSVVNLLAGRACKGWGKNHLRFDEQDVLNRLQAADAEYFPWSGAAERAAVLGDPIEASAHLDALRPFLDRASTKERPAGAEACLPDAEGRLHRLADLRRGVSIPSGLLDLDIPPTLHPVLRGHPVLKLDGWTLDRYALLDLLRDGSLAAKPPAIRKRFFAWMASHPEELGRDDWPAVRQLAVWPAVDGSLRRFEDLCLPEARVAKLLGRHIAKPTREVRLLCADERVRRTKLTLRDDPNEEEVRRFYEAEIRDFPLDRILVDDERRRFHAFEAALATLGRSKRVERSLRALRDRSIAVNRIGHLRPTTSLVREDEAVRRLGLLASDVIDRPATDLDRIFPPARRPTPETVMAALRADRANGPALLYRLAAITAEASEEVLSELEALPCLPVDGDLVAPNRLAFKGNHGDYWTGWRTVIGGEGLSDLAQDLYRAAGVIRNLPSPQTSRAYFEWLAGTSGPLGADRLACVFRHILHRQGAGAWLLQPPEIPCIPVEDGTAATLLTLSDARAAAVINDVPELADAIRADGGAPRLRLAIHAVRVPTQPIADNLAAWQIPTLSSLTRDPGNPGGSHPNDAPDFLETVHALAAPAASRRFRKQLQEFDIRQTSIEPQFQRKLLAIKRVVIVDDLTVQYRARGRAYRANRSWAVMPDAIWLDRGGDAADLLMNAVAELVFVKPRPRYLAAVLREALRHQVREFGLRAGARSDEEADEGDEGDRREEGGTAESDQHHPGGEPDPERNKPRPGKLFTGSGRRSSSSATKRRVQIEAEDIQRRQLKLDHYASHCQLELARRAPGELAPVGSYAEHGENRVRMMEAHHPDKVSAGGPRHAGNLLILSKVSHDAVGLRVSRGDVTEALRARWSASPIRHPDGTVWLDGGIAQVIDRVSGETLPLFFTNEHRDYWLAMA